MNHSPPNAPKGDDLHKLTKKKKKKRKEKKKKKRKEKTPIMKKCK